MGSAGTPTFSSPGTSGGGPFQPLDADLTAIAALTGTGIAARIAADTWALRTLLSTDGGIVVTNGDGVAGNPSLALADAGTLLGYTKLAGRIGTANNTLISTSTDGTITGSSAANKDLVLVGNNNVGSTTQVVTIHGTVRILTDIGAAGQVTLFDAAGITNSTIRGSAQIGPNPVYTLPTSITTDGFLKTNASGDLSWALLTDADIPDTITLANITQITTRLHSSLQNLVAPADDHTQYFLLAGRAGGQTAFGGTATSDHLDVWANNNAFSGGNTGRIRFNDRIILFPSSITLSNVAVANRTMIRVPSTTTFTLSVDAQPQMFLFEPTVAIGIDSIISGYAFASRPTLNMTVSQSDHHGIVGFQNGPTWKANGAGVVVVVDPQAAFVDNATFEEVAGGSFNSPISGWVSFHSQLGTLSVTAGSFQSGMTGFLMDTSQHASAFVKAVGFSFIDGSTGGTRVCVESTIPSSVNTNRFINDIGGAQSNLKGGLVRCFTPTSFVIPTDYFSLYVDHVTLGASDTITIQGTGILRIL